MDPIIDEEIMKNHNQADAFISLFFAGLDAVCYIVILTLFGCDFGSYNSPKQKLSILIVLDAVLRIINMYTDEFSKYFIKEVFLTLFPTIQFYIIVSCLNQIFEKSNENSLDSDLQIKNRGTLACIFFILVFSLKGIITNFKFLSALQYICIIIGIFVLSKYIGNKIELYLNNVLKKDPSFSGEDFLKNMSFYISLYFIINYFFEIGGLFIENNLYASYEIMLCKIFKEVGKYLVFLLLIIVYHSFDKYIIEVDFGYDSNVAKVDSSEKTKVGIYKDEDEYEES